MRKVIEFLLKLNVMLAYMGLGLMKFEEAKVNYDKNLADNYSVELLIELDKYREKTDTLTQYIIHMINKLPNKVRSEIPKVIGTEEAADILGVHVTTVRKKLRQGKLLGYKEKGKWYIDIDWEFNGVMGRVA